MELQADLDHLRSQLNIHHSAYQKLQREKDDIARQLSTANETITSLQEDLALRERLYQELRLAKDRELTELRKINTDLEARLQSALDGDDGLQLSMDAGGDQRSVMNQSIGVWSQSVTPQLSATEIVEALGRWVGSEETIALFQDLVREEKREAHWRPGTAWTSHWKPCLRVYISAHESLSESELLMEHLAELQSVCRSSGGCSIVFIHSLSPHNLPEGTLSDEAVTEVCLQEIARCDIFISILGSQADSCTKMEVEHGFLNNPSKPALFLFLSPQDQKQSSLALKLKQRVHKLSDHAVKVIEGVELSENTCSQLMDEFKDILHKLMDVPEPGEEAGSDAVFSQLFLLADMRLEYEQSQQLRQLLTRSPSVLIGMDLSFSTVDAYINDEGTVAPFLLVSGSGYGKSTLLAKCIEKLISEYQERILILTHFVLLSGSTSAEPSLMYRRFIQKMVQSSRAGNSEGGDPVPSDPAKLLSAFSQWLQKMSANLDELGLEKVVIFIDNVDLMMDCDQMGWVGQPLPKNIRVVLTVNEETTRTSLPESWRLLPTHTIPVPTAVDIQDIVSTVHYGVNRQTLPEEQAKALAVFAPSPSSQLWTVLATKYLLSCSTGLTDDEVDEVLMTLEDYPDISDLARLILESFGSTHQQLFPYVEQILQMIYWSRNGLSFSELEELTSLPQLVLCYILHQLEYRHILCEIGGLVQFTHDSVQEALLAWMDDETKQMTIWSEVLVAAFSDLGSHMISRCADELPWLLKRMELEEELKHILLNVDILIQLYCSGQGVVLRRHNISGDHFCSEFETMELQVADDRESLLYIATLMGTVGRILKNMGLLKEAQLLLQRNLELYESHSDPDSADVANAMSDLASLYLADNRYSAAESFNRQALDVYEHTLGEDCPQVIQVLDSLLTIYKAMERPELHDAVNTRLFILREQKVTSSKASSVLRKRMVELERLVDEVTGTPTQDQIQLLNELGIVCSAFGDKSTGEECFTEALKQSEQVLGENHAQTVVALRNLFNTYQQTNRMEWATPLLEQVCAILSKVAAAIYLKSSESGERQPQLVTCLNELARIYQQQERLQEAISVQEKVVALKERQTSSGHTSVAAALNNLAVLHCLLGSFAEAVPLYDKALKVYKDTYGSDHPLVTETIRNRRLAVDSI